VIRTAIDCLYEVPDVIEVIVGSHWSTGGLHKPVLSWAKPTRSARLDTRSIIHVYAAYRLSAMILA